MAETSRRKGKERMRPDPPPSSLFSATIDTPPAVRTGFDHPAANTPANVPDREQGVKTPGGQPLCINHMLMGTVESRLTLSISDEHFTHFTTYLRRSGQCNSSNAMCSPWS
jgi:hypothetical protein